MANYRKQKSKPEDQSSKTENQIGNRQSAIGNLLPLLISLILFCSFAFAQSGRNKPPVEKDKKSNPTIVAPSPTPTPKPSTTPIKDTTGQTKSDADDDKDDVVRVESNLVTIPASVLDREGNPITNLRLEDFELLVDGKSRVISAMLRSETPVKLALLFDNSSSIDKAREFEKQAAIRFFKRVLRPVDQAALYSVTDQVVLVQSLTNDTKRLAQAIESFGKPEGATSLIDAIAKAANYLKIYQERKVIVIVSDGEDTTSDLKFEEMIRIVQNAGCQVYIVNTKQFEYLAQTGRPGGNANIRSLTAERRMQEIAEQTGGAVYAPLSTKEVDNAFAQIAAELSQQYVLSYYIADDLQDGGFRVITLRVSARKDLNIRSRKGYYSIKR